jgi:DNA (cytosine-5)-methyltransferase 1
LGEGGGVTAYYNEIDPYAAQWLRNLIAAGHIAAGDVDERSIVDVRPDDLRGYSQCHFFAGIGGWSHALRLAGWPDDRPVWTGSCPCQPFSIASRGRGKGLACERHVWPGWKSLIAECRPCVVFGEQVANAGDWLDVVCDDMEAMGYAVGASVLPAASVGADHARARIYFACHANSYRKSRLPVDAETSRLSWRDCQPAGMVPTHGLPNNVACLRAFGNAIVPQAAAAFIEAAA